MNSTKPKYCFKKKKIFFKPKKEYFESENFIESNIATLREIHKGSEDLVCIKVVRIALQVARLEGIILSTRDEVKNIVYKTQIKNLFDNDKKYKKTY